MGYSIDVEHVSCPCCAGDASKAWAQERGFQLVRCSDCGLLYVNPRPVGEGIDEAVRLGHHTIDGRTVDVRARRIGGKVGWYARMLRRIYGDSLRRRPLTWLDYGAGYGEFVEAVSRLVLPGSKVIGIEPMAHKARTALAAGLDVREGYPEAGQFQADFISMINIFSHIPDFNEILQVARSNLAEDGELLIETGNVGDLDDRSEFFNILDLPDHLVFSGRPQIERFLNNNGFDVIAIAAFRVDGVGNFIKNIAKRLLGRPVTLSLPYTSKYRQLVVRARKATASA